MDVAHQAERMSGCGKHYPILSDWNGRIAAGPAATASGWIPACAGMTVRDLDDGAGQGESAIGSLSAREQSHGSSK